jgi:hypothetical protein
MSGLKKIIEEVSARTEKAGGAISTELLKKLRDYRKRQFTIFLIIEILLVVGVIVCVIFIVENPAQTTQVKVLGGIIGVGAGGGIEVMRRMWREWSQADLLILLLEEATESQVNAMIDKLIGKL